MRHEHAERHDCGSLITEKSPLVKAAVARESFPESAWHFRGIYHVTPRKALY